MMVKHEKMREEIHEKKEKIVDGLHEKRENLAVRSHETVSLGKRTIEKGDIYRLAGLALFFLAMVGLVALLMPYIKGLFEPDGVSSVTEEVRSAGLFGVFVLLGLQLLQIVVAFIPGEVTQIAAGMMYGPWLGALIILIGCVLASAFVFGLVHRLGAPFVQSLVSTKYLEKIKALEESGKLNIIVLVLFIIPGLPKDVFTYLVPLTNMRMRDFLLLTTIGRIPGVLLSTYAAHGLVDDRLKQSLIIFAVAAVIVVLGIVFREKILGALSGVIKKDRKKEHREEGHREGSDDHKDSDDANLEQKAKQSTDAGAGAVAGAGAQQDPSHRSDA